MIITDPGAKPPLWREIGLGVDVDTLVNELAELAARLK